MHRPTIFISSTIFDFRDLRSALKDYLESRGCAVNASEFNDFDKPLDTHSYEACLKAIERSDFFVLLIGARVGGWFDEKARVSITRQEYRHADTLAKAGKLKILTFVRDDIWHYRQSTKELARSLKADAALSDEQRTKITNHPTAFTTDAESIISLIDEVSKNRETAAAARGDGPLPVANWVHTFKGFSDIRQALDLLVLNGQSVDIAARKKALQSQIIAMLRQVVPSISGRPLFPDRTIARIAATLKLGSADLIRNVRVDAKTWSHFVVLAMIASKPRPEVDHIRHVLTSDLLLKYDPKRTQFDETPEYDLLADIATQASNLGRSDGASASDLLQHGRAINAAGDREAPGHVLGSHLHRMFRLADLVGSARALALALDGRPYEVAPRMPRTPFLDQEREVAEEELSLDQIRDWVGLGRLTEEPSAGVRSADEAPKPALKAKRSIPIVTGKAIKRMPDAKPSKAKTVAVKQRRNKHR
jgi:hypothetical protein